MADPLPLLSSTHENEEEVMVADAPLREMRGALSCKRDSEVTGDNVMDVKDNSPAEILKTEPLIVSSPRASWKSIVLNVADVTLPLITKREVDVPTVFTFFFTLVVSFDQIVNVLAESKITEDCS